MSDRIFSIAFGAYCFTLAARAIGELLAILGVLP